MTHKNLKLRAYITRSDSVSTDGDCSVERAKDLTFLKLSIEHERHMAYLYQTLQLHVTDSKRLWEFLSEEEINHAKRLEVLYSSIRQGNATLSPDRPSLSALESSGRDLLAKIHTWQQYGVEGQGAFEFVLLMEGGIIEDRYFAPVEGDSEIAKEIFWEMRTGTCDHFSRIKEEYDRLHLDSGFLNQLRATLKYLFLTQLHGKHANDGLPPEAPKLDD